MYVLDYNLLRGRDDLSQRPFLTRLPSIALYRVFRHVRWNNAQIMW